MRRNYCIAFYCTHKRQGVCYYRCTAALGTISIKMPDSEPGHSVSAARVTVMRVTVMHTQRVPVETGGLQSPVFSTRSTVRGTYDDWMISVRSGQSNFSADCIPSPQRAASACIPTLMCCQSDIYTRIGLYACTCGCFRVVYKEMSTLTRVRIAATAATFLLTA